LIDKEIIIKIREYNNLYKIIKRKEINLRNREKEIKYRNIIREWILMYLESKGLIQRSSNTVRLEEYTISFIKYNSGEISFFHIFDRNYSIQKIR
jgi:hypothetical protein